MLRAGFLRPKLLLGNQFHISIRNLLSTEYKNVMNTRLAPPPEADVSQLSSVGPNVKAGLSAVEIDLYMNRLASNDDRRIEICEQLMKLRLGDEAKVLDSTNNAVIRHFIETGYTLELLPILSNRLEYGIFLDEFSGCYLLDHLLSSGGELMAAQIALELMLQETLEHPLLIALAVKACYDCSKRMASDPSTIEALRPAPSTPVDPKSVQKVRVKYLRNYPQNDRSNDKVYMIGKTILKMVPKCPGDIQVNMNILGLVLAEQYQDCLELIKQAGNGNITPDIIKISLSFLKDAKDVPEELPNELNRLLSLAKSATAGFDNVIEAFVNETLQREEKSLIDQQKKIHEKWVQQRDEILKQEIERRTRAFRQENAKNILEEINAKKQKLWFFELEDKLDLDIYRKKVYYPKRWFGKKKKPRVIDDDYVPPEITKKP